MPSPDPHPSAAAFSARADDPADNPLLSFFRTTEARQIDKWMHYFEIYHRHFARFRGTDVVVVEFGVSHGGSLQMWRDYFGPEARIYGVDIDPKCAAFSEGRTKVLIGDQEDRDFLRSVAAEVGTIDVLIEDGGHTMTQQIATFEELYGSVRTDGGVFLIEDLHTSYWSEFGGGLRRKATFIEYAKGLVDQLNAWHARPKDRLEVDDFTRSTKSMHFYDSIVVFEKGTVPPPHSERSGAERVNGLYVPPEPTHQRLKDGAKRAAKKVLRRS